MIVTYLVKCKSLSKFANYSYWWIMTWYSAYFQLCFSDAAHPIDQRPQAHGVCVTSPTQPVLPPPEQFLLAGYLHHSLSLYSQTILSLVSHSLTGLSLHTWTGRSQGEVREKSGISQGEVREKAGRSQGEVREKSGISQGKVRDKLGRSQGEVRDESGISQG